MAEPRDPQKSRDSSKKVNKKKHTDKKRLVDTNDGLRHKPPGTERKDLAPPGFIGTQVSNALAQMITTEARAKILEAKAVRAEALKRAELRSHLREQVGGERPGPTLLGHDFEKARIGKQDQDKGR